MILVEILCGFAVACVAMLIAVAFAITAIKVADFFMDHFM